MRLLFVIGMQKSGTSLFNRMLMQQDFICNPFLPEGKFFWGDNPPFSPTDKPCGELYQKYAGKHGHYLDESDFTQRDKELLLGRIEQVNINEPILMNKNPYNSVRVKWLKAIFPDCKIVAIYRNPVANVFSLLKKYVECEDKTINSENGWWGIKPKNWLKIISENKTIQCSQQWQSVNRHILEDIDNIDMLVNYDDLCECPKEVIVESVSGFDIQQSIKQLPVCKNMNKEYLQGSRLLSKNRELRKNKGFDLSNLHEEIEFPPLSQEQIDQIKEITVDTWNKLISSKKNFKT